MGSDVGRSAHASTRQSHESNLSAHVVCLEEDLPIGARKIVEINGTSIGVFNVAGDYYALLNRCPHKSAPLCRGLLTGLVSADKPYEYRVDREGEIIKCPWHGWEFDIKTGHSYISPHDIRVRTYPVGLESACDLLNNPSIQTFPVTIEEELVVLYI